ncbi:riboflavin synthase [Ignavibacterium sp.]|uniref:riboflavin synthase n=1 Tax=Ignavibacterium sp. TaxID=2651167 RepID=UPI00307E8B56
MFTGLVEEKGILKEKIPTGEGFQFEISAQKVMDDLSIGSSIAVNGCCLTVVKRTDSTFSVDTIEETLNKTNLGTLKQGDKVNLERPLKTDARLGGHFVLGHIDTTGRIEDIKELSNSHWMTISFPDKFKHLLIYVGSIAIDGVSMTVAELKDNTFSVGIIPHTWKETIFSDKKIGDTVNLEFDVLGKYVERIMNNKPADD